MQNWVQQHAIQPVLQAYQQRSPREQRVLLLGSVLLAAMLGYALLYAPIQQALAQNQQQVAQLQSQAAVVAQAARLTAQAGTFTEYTEQLQSQLSPVLGGQMQIDAQAEQLRWDLSAVAFAEVVDLLAQAERVGLVLKRLTLDANESGVDATVVVAYAP